MGNPNFPPADDENLASTPEVDAVHSVDNAIDSDRTPATPSVIEVTPQPSAVDQNGAVSRSWVKTLGAQIGVAAMLAIGGVVAASTPTMRGPVNGGTEIKPDSSAEAQKNYKNLAVPMLSKDGLSYQMTGTYEQDFVVEVVSPENPKAVITVKVSPEGKYDIKGKFEHAASQVEYKPKTLDGKEIAFTSYGEVMSYIHQNPESPKPIVGTSKIHSMQGVKPTRTEVFTKKQE
ncbi:hypothetical protein IT413_06360 [Candidatus Peregrinibacteria bacterium]|nr:hypothetical protein [Candidatus Peregrinibacteria bacterium]